jgi:hypothetical protein
MEPRFSGLIQRNAPFIHLYDTPDLGMSSCWGWDWGPLSKQVWHVKDELDSPPCSRVLSTKQWPNFTALDFIGNGDMSFWVMYSLARRNLNCNQSINSTNSAKFWRRDLSCKSCYCNFARRKNRREWTACWSLVRPNLHNNRKKNLENFKRCPLTILNQCSSKVEHNNRKKNSRISNDVR